MATRYVKDANKELGSAYDPAAAAVTGQIPQIQALYDMLGASLQQAQQTGTQEVVDSAQRRGVDRASLEGQVSGVLGEEVALGQAQLGVQEAADIAKNRGSLTDLSTNRAGDAASIGSQLQEGSIDKRKAALERKVSSANYKLELAKLNRASKLQIQKLERQAELAKAAAARAAASGGGGSNAYGTGWGASGADLKDLQDSIAGGLDMVRGGDNHVSPSDYKQALAVWTRNGGDPYLFHKNNAWAVNLSHGQDYYGTAPKKKKAKTRKPAQGGGGGGW